VVVRAIDQDDLRGRLTESLGGSQSAKPGAYNYDFGNHVFTSPTSPATCSQTFPPSGSSAFVPAQVAMQGNAHSEMAEKVGFRGTGNARFSAECCLVSKRGWGCQIGRDQADRPLN
jgi:hypothetical protein